MENFHLIFFPFIIIYETNIKYWQKSIFELIVLIVFHDVSIISEIRFVQHKLQIKMERNNERTRKKINSNVTCKLSIVILKSSSLLLHQKFNPFKNFAFLKKNIFSRV